MVVTFHNEQLSGGWGWSEAKLTVMYSRVHSSYKQKVMPTHINTPLSSHPVKQEASARIQELMEGLEQGSGRVWPGSFMRDTTRGLEHPLWPEYSQPWYIGAGHCLQGEGPSSLNTTLSQTTFAPEEHDIGEMLYYLTLV